MVNVGYLKIVWRDYKAAEILYENSLDEDAYLNNVAFHLQQAVEKLLKAFLDDVGITFSVKNHDITRLIQMSEIHKSCIRITDWVIANSDMITTWGIDTRDNLDYYADREKVRIGLQEVKQFLNVNGVNEELCKMVPDEA